MVKTLLLFVIVFFTAPFASAQSVAGDILVQLEPNYAIQDLVVRLSRITDVPVKEIQVLAEKWRIYKITFVSEVQNEIVLGQIRRLPEVRNAQLNHEVQERNTTPNDPLWFQQRDMGLIGMSRAWDNTTGGLTQAGDTIVVAVLEKGMQKEHPDLSPNLWRNLGEIPNNNKDDDNNGYVDDYLGWDAGLGSGSGNGTGSSHGTSVCGIIGARGNDNVGVTGMNWNVKILPIVNASLESEIVAAYYYTGELRRQYNDTQGAKGAFIVATNASFGIDNARSADYPLWCAVYDSLGQLGVLNVGATANANRNVDTEGDMPTTCGSEFLITVTNVDANTGKKMVNAGYGAVSIDMGSPGSGTFTTTNRVIQQSDTIWHGAFGGTSAACPHTSGAIGLIYSVKCAGYVADALTNPVGCARRVREAVFNNLKEEATLADITVKGGHLDVSATIDDIMELCTGTVGDLDITDVRPNPVHDILQIRYQTPDYQERYELRVFNAVGQIIHDETFAPPAFEAKKMELNVQNWPPGMYVLVLRAGKKTITKKIIKI